MTEMGREHLPADFKRSLLLARAATLEDSRTAFEVYLDLPKKIVGLELAESLRDVSASDEHKQQLIDAEAYEEANLAYVEDSVSNFPSNLLAMLEAVEVIEPEQS